MIGSPRPRPLQQHRVGRRLLQAESHVGPDVICEQVCELVSERGSGLDPEGGVLVHQSRQVKVHHRKHSRQNAESALLGGGEPRREEPEAEGTCCGQDKALERPADGADPHRRIRLHRPVQQEVHLPSGNNAADRLAVHVQEVALRSRFDRFSRIRHEGAMASHRRRQAEGRLQGQHVDRARRGAAGRDAETVHFCLREQEHL
mmetsp:Transcript_21220/g.47866  ORF Transcript_21220/g.47866 Transcript_21220/m.47866 type:complete len:203 (+) Transcript_21220:5974-6582(+)